ncbi:hypothetical protein B8B88_26000 [Pseudomonas aeruginosa]|nr:MAG: hypothetical protein A3J25_03275 [Pseudomonadales bacterium RIFCSPLOWO2_02_FULL_63_210]PBM00704.1 hypothetical protein B8B58_33210 [Pseudomonas aeruginosa]PMZ93005.1 hypothetical protein C1X61_00455 [Pseudomonas sp. FW215-T2]PNB39436.1 hypothetical protein C1X63_02955 [Pseudomonas sp. FW305-131]PBM08476.1 hypothetical protein B8B88_26000 [Pseudomonas aeruginosa]
MLGAFVTGSHHMQLFNPIQKAELISIVEEASAKAAKNAGVVQELVFPHIYFVLSKRLSVVDGASANAEAKDSALLAALTEAKKALQDCVSVMSNDLGGLKLIQPELEGARQALAAVEAVFVGQ